jgi:hypothetical protein
MLPKRLRCNFHFSFSEGAMVRILAITKEKFTPGAEIEHLWLALVIIALIGAVGLLLMMAVEG